MTNVQNISMGDVLYRSGLLVLVLYRSGHLVLVLYRSGRYT